jgi:hypothetical protein
MQVLVDTTLAVYQGTSFPTPYDEGECRVGLHRTLFELAVNPYTTGGLGVPLGFIGNLLEKGAKDPVKTVRELCLEKVSALERLVHPICPPLEFFSVDLTSRRSFIGSEQNTGEDNRMDAVVPLEDEEELLETFDASCQTETVEEKSYEEEGEEEDDEGAAVVTKSDLKDLMEELRELRSSLVGSARRSPLPLTQSSPSFLKRKAESTLESERVVSNGNGHHSYHHQQQDEEVVEIDDDDDEVEEMPQVGVTEESSSKRAKVVIDVDETNEAATGPKCNVVESGENGISEEVLDMLQDFVDDDAPPVFAL